MERAILLILTFVWALSSSAQVTEYYRSGRPGLFYGPYSIGEGMLAWEGGLGYRAFPNTREGFSYYPQLLRVGLSEAMEIRTYFTFQERGFGRLEAPGFRSLSLADVGLRYRFTENEGSIPAIALEAVFATPLVSKPFRPRLFRPYVFVSTDNSLSSTLNLITNLGVNLNNFGWTPLAFFRLALIQQFSQQISLFVEIAGDRFIPGNQFQVDGGLTSMLSKDIQLDLSAGLGNFNDAPYYFWEFGLSARIPQKK